MLEMDSVGQQKGEMKEKARRNEGHNEEEWDKGSIDEVFTNGYNRIYVHAHYLY